MLKKTMYGAIPIGQQVHLKEEYGHIVLDFFFFLNNEQNWVIFVGQKVNFFFGQLEACTDKAFVLDTDS